MKTRCRWCVYSVLLFAGLAVAQVASAGTPLGSGFTYQGQLKQDGSAVNGTVDLSFALWDETGPGGTQVGATQTVAGATVTNGLFAVELNAGGEFGPGPFTGERRWLEISVNGTVLTPRQELTLTPHAAFSLAPWASAGGNVSYTTGKVGIGTNDPQALLHLGGVAGVDGVMFPDGSLQTTAAVGGGGGDSVWSLNGIDAYYNAGNVGIGTSSPAAKLDISAIGNGAQVLRLTTERPWIFSQIGTGSGTRLRLAPATGLKNFEITGPAGGPVATFFADETNPAVGIGTATPLSRLDIAASGAGAELLRFTTERPWIFRQISTGPSTGLQLYSTSGAKNFEITCVSGVNCATFFTQDAAPRVGIGTTTPATTLDVNGTTRTKVLQITGADLAEKFPASEKVEPGTVMEIDPENAGQLRMARDAYNQRVAGVVSGANDFPAGAVLGNLPGQEDAPAVALSGRVWTRCDAGTAAIVPGDLLTTSATPGHAMKAIDRERSHGAVIGKAMTALKRGKTGLVLVLVNLQ